MFALLLWVGCLLWRWFALLLCLFVVCLCIICASYDFGLLTVNVSLIARCLSSWCLWVNYIR